MNKKGIILYIDGEKVKDEMPKQQMKIGNYTVYFYKNFNLFHRTMIRLLFGLKVEKVSDKE